MKTVITKISVHDNFEDNNKELLKLPEFVIKALEEKLNCLKVPVKPKIYYIEGMPVTESLLTEEQKKALGLEFSRPSGASYLFSFWDLRHIEEANKRSLEDHLKKGFTKESFVPLKPTKKFFKEPTLWDEFYIVHSENKEGTEPQHRDMVTFIYGYSYNNGSFIHTYNSHSGMIPLKLDEVGWKHEFEAKDCKPYGRMVTGISEPVVDFPSGLKTFAEAHAEYLTSKF